MEGEIVSILTNIKFHSLTSNYQNVLIMLAFAADNNVKPVPRNDTKWS